ncbi:perlucin-like protein [Patiria miniata]|uniref:C-type lectin domain-containing protein n=1 Tax=Patiria miniata TaxID=46514 RepID=A0A913Z5A3_PATMI|nr:perlucin-like protein [Patiria miniata]
MATISVVNTYILRRRKAYNFLPRPSLFIRIIQILAKPSSERVIMYFFKVFGFVTITSAINAQFGSGTCHSRLTLECSCPPQWQWWGKDCYRLTPVIAQAWDQAKSACQNMGGKMAAPRSHEEMNFMTDMARKVDSNFFAWIACTDKEVEGTWECDGQEDIEPFLEWDDGQPDDKNNNQDCCQIAATFNDKMDDDDCDNMSPRLAFCIRRAACTYGLIQLRQ